MNKYHYRIKYFIARFVFIKALWSPFKPFKLVWHFGKITIGTPYFFPRRWVKDKSKPGYLNAIPKKIGFDFVALGWKTKWTDNDYRFEWAPLWSFVFFGKQIAVMFIAPEQTHYWEAWLYYEYSTDHSLSKKERIRQCREKFSLTWDVSKSGESVAKTVDYYEVVLKQKYLK